jgi:TRAP-type C4-dicarboxylate transport system permease small subunit
MHASLERLLRWSTGLLAAVALFAIMWLTFVDVMGRKFLSHSVPGGLEMTEMLMVVVIFGALSLVSARGEHVVFDSFDHRVPPWVHRLRLRVVNLVCAATFGLMAWLLTVRAERFAEYGEMTVHLQLPIAPVAWLMAVLLALTALVHLVHAAVLPPEGDAAPHEGAAT